MNQNQGDSSALKNFLKVNKNMYLSLNDPGCYRKAYKYDQDNYKIALNYAKYLEDRGKKEEALELYKEAYALNNNCFEAREKINELSFKPDNVEPKKKLPWKRSLLFAAAMLSVFLLAKGCSTRTNAVGRGFAYTFLNSQSQIKSAFKNKKNISSVSVPLETNFAELERWLNSYRGKDEDVVFYKEDKLNGQERGEYDKNSRGTIFAYAERNGKDSKAKLYVNSYGGLPLLDLRVNYLRTAALNYMIEKCKPPLSLNQLKEEGYILDIPAEPLTFSKAVNASLDGGGGWVFNPSVQYSGSLNGYVKELVSPNLLDYTQPFSPFKIVVNKDDFLLDVWAGEKKVFSSPVGLGKNDLTPEGQFHVEEIVIPEESNSVYGNGILALSVGEIAIHGTNDPSSIGKNSSLGCIRVGNEDMAQLLSFIPKGTAVEIKSGEIKEKTAKFYKD